jgi:two-component system phosphate regulon sensor histidine kinase PhoR
MAAAALAGSLAFGIAAGAILRSALRARAMDRIDAETAQVASSLEQLGPAVDLSAFTTRAASALGVRVTVVAKDGRVLADSAVVPERLAELENHLDRPEIAGARTAGLGRAIRDSHSTDVPYFYSARVARGVDPVGYVRLALPLSELHAIVAAPFPALVLAVGAAMLVVLAVGYGGMRRLSRPIEHLAAAVERAGSSPDVAVVPAVSGAGAEIERLASGLRRLNEAQVERLAELERERQVLATVVAGVREGLLLVGADHRLHLANDAARAILDLRHDPRGARLEEAVRHPNVVRDVAAALAGETPVPTVVRLPGSERSFELRAVPIDPGRRPGGGGALVLLLDVTRLEALERLRQEFVADVSHELRTPLTSIRAAVENLLDGGIEDRQHARGFLEIARRHAERMAALIEDLTDLSLIETGAVRLEHRSVDVAEVVREILDPLAPLAAARRVALRSELGGPFPIYADRRRLEQMLGNLVDNAIKFNREGGTVVVRGSRDESGSTVIVEDTGIGIATDSLERVFQRFYQVERGRSREQRGTGLGLSIVKHLMRLHGGRVRIESELGTGSRFFLVFPPDPFRDGSL